MNMEAVDGQLERDANQDGGGRGVERKGGRFFLGGGGECFGFFFKFYFLCLLREFLPDEAARDVLAAVNAESSRRAAV